MFLCPELPARSGAGPVELLGTNPLRVANWRDFLQKINWLNGHRTLGHALCPLVPLTSPLGWLKLRKVLLNPASAG
jgi:hypothetical protein